MKIQFIHSKKMTGSEELRTSLNTLISEELSIFSRRIIRLEVHLSDEDGFKHGQDDKCCMIEARLEGRHSIAVTNEAHSFEQATNGAITMLTTCLKTINGPSAGSNMIKHNYEN